MKDHPYEPVVVERLRILRLWWAMRFSDGRQAFIATEPHTGAHKALRKSYTDGDRILVRLRRSSQFEGVAYMVISAIEEPD